MITVSATEAKQGLASLLDTVQRQPVVIRRQKRDVAVMISPQEYERLHGIAVAEFQRFCDQVAKQAAARGMNEEVLAELLADDE